MRLVASLLMFVSAVALAKAPATLDDLKLLAQQQAYAELLERAEDVAPAARTDAWRDLVAGAAAGVVLAAPIGKAPFAEATTADALVARFRFLDKREAFVAARDEAVLKGLKRCLDFDSDACLAHFASYERTLDAAGSLAAGKLLRRHGAFAYRPMLLFAKAAASKDAAACKDADVADAVIAALDLPSDHEAVKAAQRVAFEACWPALQARLRSTMVGAQAARLRNSCQQMRAKKALTTMQEELCKDEEQNSR